MERAFGRYSDSNLVGGAEGVRIGKPFSNGNQTLPNRSPRGAISAKVPKGRRKFRITEVSGVPEWRAAALRTNEGWRKILKPDLEQAASSSVVENSRVDVWVARTDSLLQGESLKILTSDDWNTLARLKTSAARDCATATRILLRLGLSEMVDDRISPREWHFKTTPFGKPVISNHLPVLNFNISHADAVIVVAISSRLQLGIDIESIDQELTEDVIAGFCNAQELAVIRGCHPAQRTREFIRLWTRKEAYGKLLGFGHLIDFSSMNGLPDAFGIECDAHSTSSIHFESFYVPIDRSLYHASLAIEKISAGTVDIRIIDVIRHNETKNAFVISVGVTI
jgi:phosphopantetheinyl transferase